MRTSCRLLTSALLAAARLSAAPAEGSLLPRTIPGYELRTLDVRKTVLVQVEGGWVQASVPVFLYFPAGDPAGALPVLRGVYGDLVALGSRPAWTAAELRGLIARLDGAIRLLERQTSPEAPPAIPGS
jgi:hypothetical protein